MAIGGLLGPRKTSDTSVSLDLFPCFLHCFPLPSKDRRVQVSELGACLGVEYSVRTYSDAHLHQVTLWIW